MAAEAPPPAFDEPYDASGNFSDAFLDMMAHREPPGPPPPGFELWDISSPLRRGPWALQAAVDALHDAFEKGSDSDVVAELTSCTPSKLAQLRAGYEAAHGSLETRVKRKTGGQLENLLLVWLGDTAVLDAELLNASMKGIGTNEHLLAYVIITRSRADMLAAAAKYAELYRKPLVDAIRSEVGGSFAALLTAIAAGSRADDGPVIDRVAAAAQAQALLEASELASKANPQVFIDLFSQHGPAHLAVVASEYQKISRVPRTPKDTPYTQLEAVIKSKLGGSNDFTYALQGCLQPGCLVAEQVKAAIDGAGTNDMLLQRVIVRTRGAAMQEAKYAYASMYKKAMVRAIEGDLSGDYLDAVRRICAQSQGALLAAIVRKAFVGMGTDEQAAVDVMTLYAQSQYERDELSSAFAIDYGKSLASAIKSEMGSSALATYLSTIAHTQIDWDVHQCREAMKGMGTDDAKLAMPIAAASPAHLEKLKAEYAMLYGKPLADAVAGDVSGNLGLLLGNLLTHPRAGTTLPDSEIAVTVERIFTAGEGTVGTNDRALVEIFSRYSPLQLAAIDTAYRAAHKTALFSVIEKECGDNAIGSALQACCNPPLYYSRQFKKAMKGMGTNEQLLVATLAHLSPDEFRIIDNLYNEENHVSILESVKKEVSGRLRLACVRTIHALLGLPVE